MNLKKFFRKTSLTTIRRRLEHDPKFVFGRLRQDTYQNRYRKNYSSYGRKFLNTFEPITLKKGNSNYVITIMESLFEAPLSLGVYHQPRIQSNLVKNFYPKKKPEENLLFELKINFKKDKIVITAIQGKKGYGILEEMNKFKKLVNTHAPNYLLRLIEKHGKETGYEKIQIIRPEHLEWFSEPAHCNTEQEKEKIRQRMLSMYSRIAKKEGYTKRSRVFEKKLN
jgi:hypothetical protein